MYGFAIRVDAKWVGFCIRVVYPVSSYSGVLFENDDVVVFAFEFACGDEA